MTDLKITRNTSYYTIALVFQKLISFFYFSYIAVKIGASSLGNYTFALFFTTMFAVLADIGLSNILVREVSKNKEKVQEFFSSVMAIKLPLQLITYGLVFLVINLIENDPLVRQLVYLAGIVMVLDSLTLAFYSFLRGFHNLKYESIGVLIFELVVVITGFTAISLTSDLRILMLAIVAGSFFNFVYSLALLKSKLKLKLKLKINPAIARSFLILCIPFGLAAIFTRIYGYLDTILVKQLVDGTALGFYSLPYKITFSLQFLPMAFVATLYPAFSTYFGALPEKLERTFEKSMVYLSMIAVPISFGVIALAKEIIVSIYTQEYLPSVIALQILISSLLFLFLNFPLGSLLNACNRQVRNTVHIGIVMVVNAFLNIVLIPEFSYVGASIASVASTILMFLLQFSVARQITPVNFRFLSISFGKIILAGGLMYLAIVSLIGQVNFLFLIPLGALIYVAILWLLKAFDREDLQMIFKIVARR